MATKMTTMMIVMMIELKKEERICPDRVAASNTKGVPPSRRQGKASIFVSVSSKECEARTKEL